jgi:endoplasmic reticulum-Golgi intermediate compartment protein 3
LLPASEFRMAKSRFTRLDAFTKTVEDARIRTTSGGIVTIVSLIVVLFLSWGEWRDYRKVVVHPELIVDKGRGKTSRGTLRMCCRRY